MRYLLDTHVFLWAESAPEVLSSDARAILEQPSAELLLSAASVHEIAVKWRLGKLSLPTPPAQFVATRMARSRLVGLPLSLAHAAQVAVLPDLHADPFDRLLVAQAQVEGLTLITRDAVISRYDVPVVKA